MRNNQPVTQREHQVAENQRLISTTNLKGMITYCNEVFIDISGFSEAELLGSNHNIVRHPDMPPQAFAHMWQTLKAGRSWMGLVKNRCKNGDHYWVSAYATPAILGGPATEVMATLIRNFMVQTLDWGPGAAMGAILITSAVVLLVLTSWLGERKAAT